MRSRSRPSVGWTRVGMGREGSICYHWPPTRARPRPREECRWLRRVSRSRSRRSGSARCSSTTGSWCRRTPAAVGRCSARTRASSGTAPTGWPRSTGGIQWVGGGPTFVRNPLVPGFEPTGVGASGPGVFRHPALRRAPRRVHGPRSTRPAATAACSSCSRAPCRWLPRTRCRGYNDHKHPPRHERRRGGVAGAGVRRVGRAGRRGRRRRASSCTPTTTTCCSGSCRRSPTTATDGYGGSFENRRRFVREIVESIRDHVDRPITLGLRLCLDEMIEGGYGIDECQALLSTLHRRRHGRLLQPRRRQQLGRGELHPTGRLPRGRVGRRCAARPSRPPTFPSSTSGASCAPRPPSRCWPTATPTSWASPGPLIADPAFVGKARPARSRPSGRASASTTASTGAWWRAWSSRCAANPTAGREHQGLLPPVSSPRSILVVGGGPAGMELAALSAERGHRVALWERERELGGQLAIAALARANAQYAEWIRWQERRIDQLGHRRAPRLRGHGRRCRWRRAPT